MNTNQHSFYKSALSNLLTTFFFLFSIVIVAQETPETVTDSTKTGYSLGQMQMPNPNSIVSKYTYDPVTDRYIYTESVGQFNINYPVILTPQEYQSIVDQENMQSYY